MASSTVLPQTAWRNSRGGGTAPPLNFVRVVRTTAQNIQLALPSSFRLQYADGAPLAAVLPSASARPLSLHERPRVVSVPFRSYVYSPRPSELLVPAAFPIRERVSFR